MMKPGEEFLNSRITPYADLGAEAYRLARMVGDRQRHADNSASRAVAQSAGWISMDAVFAATCDDGPERHLYPDPYPYAEHHRQRMRARRAG
jgi:hypothetical protein